MLRVLCLPNGKMTCMRLQNLSRTVRYSHRDCVQRPCPQASWMYLYNCTHVVTTTWLEVLYKEIPFSPFRSGQQQGTRLTITMPKRQSLQKGIAAQLKCQLHLSY